MLKMPIRNDLLGFQMAISMMSLLMTFGSWVGWLVDPGHCGCTYACAIP
jgi:hypothetical protein